MAVTLFVSHATPTEPYKDAVKAEPDQGGNLFVHAADDTIVAIYAPTCWHHVDLTPAS